MATTADGTPIVQLCYGMDAADYLADDLVEQVRTGTNVQLMDGFVPTTFWGELLASLKGRTEGYPDVKVVIWRGTVIVLRASENVTIT